MSESAPTVAGDEEDRECPKCRLVMNKAKYGELGATTVDVCKKCKGIWLDPGELERIQLTYEAVNPESVTLANPTDKAELARFACPKCGKEQVESAECISCGIIFAKYNALQEGIAQRDTQSSKNTAEVDEQFNAISGFEVTQQHHLTEALLSFERANEYTLQPKGGNSVGVWHIQEINANGFSILGRQLFGLLFTFTMELFDSRRNKILVFQRLPRLYFHALEIYDENGTILGLAKRRFSFFNRVVTIENATGMVLLKIVGPVWKPWTFNISQGKADIGKISKKWSGGLRETFTDSDNFSIRFKDSMSPKLKRLVLGGLMLTDSLYFEGNKNFVSHFFSAPALQLVSAVVSLVILFVYGVPS